MQTTLRIDDQLYREAKAEAAREGTTLTRFLEEGLRLRLAKANARQPTAPYHFPIYDPPVSSSLTDEEIRRIDREEQERFYLRKIGLGQAPS